MLLLCCVVCMFGASRCAVSVAGMPAKKEPKEKDEGPPADGPVETTDSES